MECVAYIRVSTEAQVEDGYGLDSQKRDIENYCRSNQLIITDWYVDAGLSGMDMSKRLELQRMISDVNKIQKIVVYKLDRLARDTVDALYMIEKIFTPKNIEVISVHDFARYDTPQAKFQTHIMAAVAEYDRNTMLLRMKGGMLERVKNGYWMGGGNTPYCYRYDRESGILIPIEERKIRANRAMDLYIEGHSDLQIQKMLGYNTEMVVRSILTGVVNIGLIPYKGNVYQGKHEPIFDKEKFEIAQTLRKARRKNRYSCVTKPYILTGLCKCGICGCAMRYQKWGDKGHKICCMSRHKGNDYIPNYNPDCNNSLEWASDIENKVASEIKKISLNLSGYKPKEKENKLEIMQSQLAKEQTKLKRMYSLYADGNDTVIDMIKSLEKSVNDMKDKIASEQSKADDSGSKNFVYDNIKKVADVWDHIDNQQKNKLLKSIIDKIVIVNGDIEIQLKYF